MSINFGNKGYSILPQVADLEMGIVKEQEKEQSKVPEQCNHRCCNKSSPLAPSYTTVTGATLPFLSRGAAKELSPVQSYNYTQFQKNQVEAIEDKSAKQAALVISSTLNVNLDGKEKSNGQGCEKDLVTNNSSLVASRFLPANQVLNKEEEMQAIAEDEFQEEPLVDSVVGLLAKGTKTMAGKEFIYVRGSNPINNQQVIENRQAVIRALVNDPEVCEALRKALAMYGDFEKEFCSRLSPTAAKLPGRIEAYLKFSLIDIPETVGKQINEYIRESTNLLTINNYIKTTQDGFNIGFSFVLALACTEYLLNMAFPHLVSTPIQDMVVAFVSRYIGQTGTITSTLQSSEWTPVKALAACLAIISIAAKAPDALGYLGAEMAVKVALQNKMADATKCIRAMKLVHDLIKDQPVLTENLEHFQKLENLIQGTGVEHGGKVQKMLQAVSSRSLDAPSKFFNLGPALVTWNLLLDKEVKELVMKAIIAMGEMDADLALADKISQQKPGDKPFCIPTIVDENQPATFEVKEAHFAPLIPLPDQPATSDRGITDVKLSPITILTANNGAGKTIFALSWINTLLSAQSFGIAPCAEAKISIFDNIVTSGATSDNNSQSANESHENFAMDLVEKLKNHPNQKTFVLLDEFFRTTNETKGSKALRAFTQELSAKPNKVKAVYITHFKTFANDKEVEGVRYTTNKINNRPSGVLEEGVFSGFL